MSNSIQQPTPGEVNISRGILSGDTTPNALKRQHKDYISSIAQADSTHTLLARRVSTNLLNGKVVGSGMGRGIGPTSAMNKKGAGLESRYISSRLQQTNSVPTNFEHVVHQKVTPNTGFRGVKVQDSKLRDTSQGGVYCDISPGTQRSSHIHAADEMDELKRNTPGNIDTITNIHIDKNKATSSGGVGDTRPAPVGRKLSQLHDLAQVGGARVIASGIVPENQSNALYNGDKLPMTPNDTAARTTTAGQSEEEREQDMKSSYAQTSDRTQLTDKLYMPQDMKQPHKPLQRLKYPSAPIFAVSSGDSLTGVSIAGDARMLGNVHSNSSIGADTQTSSIEGVESWDNEIDLAALLPSLSIENSSSSKHTAAMNIQFKSPNRKTLEADSTSLCDKSYLSPTVPRSRSPSLSSDPVVSFIRPSKVASSLPTHSYMENAKLCLTGCSTEHSHTHQKMTGAVRNVTFSMFDQVYEIPIEDRKGKWKEEGLQLYEQQSIVDRHPDLGSALDVLNRYDDFGAIGGSGGGTSPGTKFEGIKAKMSSTDSTTTGLGQSTRSVFNPRLGGGGSTVGPAGSSANTNTHTYIQEQDNEDNTKSVEGDEEGNEIAKNDRFATAAAQVIDIDGNARADFMSVRTEDTAEERVGSNKEVGVDENTPAAQQGKGGENNTGNGMTSTKPDSNRTSHAKRDDESEEGRKPKSKAKHAL